jgi:hypothetical protein
MSSTFSESGKICGMTLKKLVVFFLFALITASCTSQPVALESTETPESIATATSIPTATPQPAKAVLVMMDDPVLQPLRELVSRLAVESGLQLEQRTEVQSGDVMPEWKVVVFATPPANLNDLVNTAPGTQFLTFSSMELPQAPNLSVISSRADWQAFVAGYLTTLVAFDWRTAAFLPSDLPESAMMSDAFRNGQYYFCGRCATYYAPYASFPLIVSLPAVSSVEEWKLAASPVQQNYAYGVYVSPQAASPDLLNYLAGFNLTLLGGRTPPPEILPHWAVTLQMDELTPLEQLWTDLVVGRGGKTVTAEFRLTDVNPELLTPGRQMQVEKVIQGLREGIIASLSPPLE